MPPKDKADLKNNPEAGEQTPSPAKAAAAGTGGIKAWVPLLANLLLMPVLAYATVTFVLKSQHAAPSAAAAAAAETTPKAEAHSPAKSEVKDGAKGGVGKTKYYAPLEDKVLVNLAGTQGTRYLVARITLILANAQLIEAVKENKDVLKDAAANVLRVKTISDLERRDSHNLIRAELVSVFCNVLGDDGAVTGILLTEFAIQ